MMIWVRVCLAASRLEVWAVIFRMLSPLSTRRWALWTRRSRTASAMVGIGDDLVPVIDRHLAGDDGRAALMPVVHDLEEIAALLGGERSEAPVVEDQELDPRERS